MAQHIGIIEVDEQGRQISATDANFAPVNKVLYLQPDWKQAYPWLATIDEYGDTMFNYLQLPHVVQELQLLRTAVQEAEVLNEIEKITDYLAQHVASDERHRYIKFIGD